MGGGDRGGGASAWRLTTRLRETARRGGDDRDRDVRGVDARAHEEAPVHTRWQSSRPPRCRSRRRKQSPPRERGRWRSTHPPRHRSQRRKQSPPRERRRWQSSRLPEPAAHASQSPPVHVRWRPSTKTAAPGGGGAEAPLPQSTVRALRVRRGVRQFGGPAVCQVPAPYMAARARRGGLMRARQVPAVARGDRREHAGRREGRLHDHVHVVLCGDQ